MTPAGLSVVQLLPVNDTSVKGDWRDSYPYSSLCVFALHPLYLCLDRLPGRMSVQGCRHLVLARAAAPKVHDCWTMLGLCWTGAGACSSSERLQYEGHGFKTLRRLHVGVQDPAPPQPSCRTSCFNVLRGAKLPRMLVRLSNLLSHAMTGADASAIQEEVAEARRRLNLPDMDYEQTLAAKLAIARKLFDAAFPQLLVSRRWHVGYHPEAPRSRPCLRRNGTSAGGGGLGPGWCSMHASLHR